MTGAFPRGTPKKPGLRRKKRPPVKIKRQAAGREREDKAEPRGLPRTGRGIEESRGRRMRLSVPLRWAGLLTLLLLTLPTQSSTSASQSQDVTDSGDEDTPRDDLTALLDERQAKLQGRSTRSLSDVRGYIILGFRGMENRLWLSRFTSFRFTGLRRDFDGGMVPGVAAPALTLFFSNNVIVFQDPYVSASPLSVAAVCRDGTVLVALHYDDRAHLGSGSSSGDDSTTVQTGSNDADTTCMAGEVIEDKSMGKVNRTGTIMTMFRDLPMSTRGPLRIESIHEVSSPSPSLPPTMALVTAGWRTDGMVLADAARELVSEEVRTYCLPHSVVEDFACALGEQRDGGRLLEGPDSTLHIVGNQRNVKATEDYYGRRVADGLRHYLSRCTFSEGLRTLSTVGLLACGANIEGDCLLYLIDATSTHRVRAHAIGRGATGVNRRLMFVNFEVMSCEEGLAALLNVIAGDATPENGSDAKSPTKPAFMRHERNRGGLTAGWSLVETAMIRPGQGIKRVRLSALASNPKLEC